jgi:PPOX class probable F420-dependent enzyme
MEPVADRPWMPGYGTLPAGEGTGLLPWSWAVERLEAAHDFWLATAWPDGRPHVMPVWAVWWNDGLWFSSGLRSRKARNLARDPRCTLTTDDARNPVVVDGSAERIVDLDLRRGFIDATNEKYDTTYTVDFLDPEVNGTYRVTPDWAFGLVDGDFEGSPTRWRA